MPRDAASPRDRFAPLPLALAALALGGPAGAALGCGGAGAGRGPVAEASVVVPPAPSPPASALAVASLPLGVTSHGSMPADAIFGAGGRALVVRGATLSLLEIGATKPSAQRVLPPDTKLLSWMRRETPVIGGVVLATSAGSLLSFDAGTLAPRWSAGLGVAAESTPRAVSAAGLVVLAVVREPPGAAGARQELVGVDAVDGKVLWSRPAAPTYGLWASGDRALAYHVSPPSLEAFDARTGRTLWARNTPCNAGVVADEAHVAFACGDGKLHVLDAATGETRHEAAVGPLRPWGEMTLGGGKLFAHLSSAREGEARRVVSVDLSTGALAWSAPTGPSFDGAAGDAGGLALTADEVIACHEDGTVRAFDRATGRERWRWGAGGCGPMAAFGSADGAIAYLSAQPATIELLAEGRARGPEKATVKGHVTLYGEPLAGAKVWAFGVATTADADGRFALEFAGRGRFFVRARAAAEGSEKCDPFVSGQSDPRPLDGRREYSIDVEATRACWCGA